MDEIFDSIVIGGGQAGLAAAYHLRKAGLTFTILEKNRAQLGSWASYYDSLKLFSPAKYSSLPGMPFPGKPNRYPDRDEVVRYLDAFAKHFDIPIQFDQEVIDVSKENDLFRIRTANGKSFYSRSLICASGPFTKPFVPQIPGMNDFRGEILHSKQYTNKQEYTGQKIVVVGAGNSAVQIAVELAEVAEVMIATRSSLKFLPQIILGRDLHFWLTVLGLDQSRLGKSLLGEGSGVLDTGKYQHAIANNRPKHQKMFDRFTKTGIVWSDGTSEEVDTVLFATGFSPNYGYLDAVGALDAKGHPLTNSGVSTKTVGLYFVGLPLQTSFASATIRGVGKDAKYVVRHLSKALQSSKACCFNKPPRFSAT